MLRLTGIGIRLFNGLLCAFPALVPDGHPVTQFCRNLRHGLIQYARAL